MGCRCFEAGDDVGEITILENDPVEISMTKDKKHIFVDDVIVWCGVED